MSANPVPSCAIIGFHPNEDGNYPPVSFAEYLAGVGETLEQIRRHPCYDDDTVFHVAEAYRAIANLYEENTSMNYYRAFSARMIAKPYLPEWVQVDLARRITYFYQSCMHLHKPAFDLIDYLVPEAFSDDEVDGYSYMKEAKMESLFTEKPFQDEVARLGVPEEVLKNLFLETFRAMVFLNEYPQGSE